LSASGCGRDSGGFVPDASTSSLSSGEAENLKKQIDELEIKVFDLEFRQNEFRTAWFDTSEGKGFGRVDANIGFFLVTLENVEPYLDGQKVTLLIGNPHSVAFNGFELKASWSARYPDRKLPSEEKEKQWKAFRASQRDKDIKLTNVLRPGVWNKVQFTIAPAKPDEFGRLGISISTNHVSLSTK